MEFHLFGLLDAENVSVAVIHYVAPAAVLLYFIFTSVVPTSQPGSESSTGPSGAPSSRTRQLPQSGILKWLFLFVILTFVCTCCEGIG